MEKNQTEEGNRIIALFMGGFLNPRWKDKPTYTFKLPPFQHAAFNWSADEMRYHESWGWLMPVVEKISKDFTVNIHSYPGTGFDCTIKEGNYRRGYGESTKEPILSVYSACIDFILWYNTQTSQTK